MGRKYLVGLTAVAAVALGITFLLSPADRRAVWLALAVAMLVQGPVGWWLVRSVGGPAFLLAWIVGMGTRLALVLLFVFGLVPALALPPSAALFSLVSVLLALLLVEVVVVNLGHRQAGLP